MKKKFSYQRGHKNKSENVVIIPIKNRLLAVPKDNVFLKALEVEADLSDVTEDKKKLC